MFTIKYSGYNYRNPDHDLIYRPNGSGDYLFLLILSPMIFHINQMQIHTKPGACILYTPDQEQHYEATGEFLNSFIHFSCDADFLADCPLPQNTLFYPSNVEEINWLCKNISLEYFTKPPHFNAMCESYCRQLLIQVSRALATKNPSEEYKSDLYESFVNLRLSLLVSCESDWNVERMCSQVNLEKSQLFSYYKLFFNTTPKSDLIRTRIDKAKYLLSCDAMPIGQVAAAAGFKNVCHFNRYFKQYCDCTPGEYKKQVNLK